MIYLTLHESSFTANQKKGNKYLCNNGHWLTDFLLFLATSDTEPPHSLGLSWSGGITPENITKSKWMVPLNASIGGYSKRSASMYLSK